MKNKRIVNMTRLALVSCLAVSFSAVAATAMPSITTKAPARAQTTAPVIELDRIAAKVEQDVVMESELKARVVQVIKQAQSRNMGLPPMDALQEQVLEQLIMESIQLQLAAQSGIVVDDRMLDATIARIAAGNKMSVADFRAQLEASGTPFSEAREDIRREMLLNQVRQSQVAQRVQVSEQEIDNFFKSPEGQAALRSEYRLSHILLPLSSNGSLEEAQMVSAQAKALSEQLRQGDDFAAAAITYSQDSNAAQGGDMGWRTAEQLPTLFAKQAKLMRKGEVSAPIQSGAGFHIFKLSDKRGNETVLQKQVNVRHILIKPNEIRNNADSEALAEKIRSDILAGASFNTLAKAYSEDPGSALNGGEMGWIDPTIMVPEFQAAMKLVPKNTVSEPFRTTYGWHILEVLGERETDISEEMRRNKARELLSNRKFQEEVQMWLRDIRDQAFVELSKQK